MLIGRSSAGVYLIQVTRDSRQLKVFTVQFAAVFSRANGGTGSMDNV